MFQSGVQIHVHHMTFEDTHFCVCIVFGWEHLVRVSETVRGYG